VNHPNSELEPSSITNLQEARDAMKRKRGSFEEWLECAGIFSANRLWPEFEQAALRTLESAVNRPIKPPLLKQAAMNYAAASLKTFSSKAEFEVNCKNTISTLKRYSSHFPADSERIKSYFEYVIEALDEITILLSEGSPRALVSIASKLRKRLGRPDLSIAVASVALREDPDEYAAYVTRGSAYTELENYPKAIEDFVVAQGNSKSRPYAIAGHTKLLIREGKFELAVDLGEELLERKPTRPILYLLAAAVKGAKDENRFSELVEQADALPDSEPGTGKLILLRQSITILIENNQFETAEELINQLALIERPSRVNVYRVKLNKSRQGL
jgi:tetratricopeptide (TPR) repeat protein